MRQGGKRNPRGGSGGRWRFAALLLSLALLAPRADAGVISDFVFVVDQSASMEGDLRNIADQVLFLPTILLDEGIDPQDVRVAIVAFGTNRSGNGPVEPRLALDWVGSVDTASIASTFDALANDVVRETESGTEAIRFALDQLAFRPEAKVNVVLFTDEDDDRPALIEGDREPPAGWTGCLFKPSCLVDVAFHQEQVDLTADALINTAAGLASQQVLLNMIINPGDRPSRYQYGDPDATRLTPAGRLDLASTLVALDINGYEESLQGQLLSVGLLARAFAIAESRGNPSAFWESFFRVKAQEIVPEPGSLALLLTALMGTLLLRQARSR